MSLTPDEIEAERERFEAWWAKRWGNGTKPEREGKGYWGGPAHHAWFGWLAAIESDRDRVRQRQEDAEVLMRMQEPQRARMLEKWESGE